MFYASLLTLLAPASAQEALPDEQPPLPTAAESGSPVVMPQATPARKRGFLMEVGFRARYMDLPDLFLDTWYYKNDDGGEFPERPHISAYSLGIEFVIRDEKANGIFYVEYLNPLMEGGYWDDVESPPDHFDGSWMEPNKFGLVMIGANYAYEIKANNWFSWLFGFGVGGAIKMGELEEWKADGSATCMLASGTGAECPSDGFVETIPVLPYLDINLGPRFNISDRASIRIEGGIHGFLPFGGGSVGITF